MKGIPFNQDGVTAILEDRKTMTRRPIKIFLNDDGSIYDGSLSGYVFEGIQGMHELAAVFYNSEKEHAIFAPIEFVVGETVYVQEEMRIDCYLDVWYVADDEYVEAFIDDGIKPYAELNEEKYPEEYVGIVKAEDMPKECARISLKLTDIKAEYLQDISEEDILKEGLSFTNGLIKYDKEFKKETFKNVVWDVLPYQPPYDWGSNRPVLAYEFEVVK